MSKVATGKSEYRERQEYRESYPGGLHRSAGIGQAAPYILTGLMLIITVMGIGGWMLFQWWIKDAWNTNPIGVLTVNTIIISLVGYAIWWNIKVRYDRHEVWKRRQLAEIGVLEVQPRVIEGQADKGFNTEIIDAEGSAVRTVNPLSIAAASKETNNYYGYDGEGDDDGLPKIEAPKTPTLSEQLGSGATSPNEETSIIGYMDGEPFRAKIFDARGNLFNSVFVFGDQGHGKSTFGTYLAALTILQGGKLIVIDPESEDPQALTKRLGPLAQERYLLCPIADTPEKAQRAMQIARSQIEIIGNHPVLLLIDEFTLIARETANGRGTWSEVGGDILDVCESYSTRGRKKRCRVICFGQIPKATRAGNTEVRDTMATVCFNLKKTFAQRVLEADDAEKAPSLRTGEIILAPSATTHRLQLPYPDKDGLNRVATMGRDIKWLPKPSEDDFETGPEDFVDSKNDGDDLFDTNEPEMSLDEPVEPVGDSPKTRPYAVMSELQTTQFVALYPLVGIEKALDRIDGCSHRHREHARQIIRERNLKRKDA